MPSREGAALAAHADSGYNFQVLPVSATITVRVLFFGRIRELAGMSEESTHIAEGATLDDLFLAYCQRFPQMKNFHGSLVASRNQEFAAWDTPIAAGDEIAFLPPVSGG
jgi:molybdopterin converting factor subunit 1